MPLALLSVVLLLGTPPGAVSRPPNVVLILADDLGWGDVGFNGRTEWTTPHLDRLGAEGTIFKRWYTAAVVCAPSRAALMTGKSTIHNGVSRNNDDLPASEVTIAEALKAKGYVAALFGKWHHGAPRPPAEDYVHPMDQGFDEFFGFTDAKHAWEKHPEKLWEGRELKPSKGWANDLFTDRAVDFVKRSKDRPFFLYLAYTDPHFDVEAHPDDAAKLAGKFPGPETNAHYAAMIHRMDRNIGRVIAAIDQLGLAENTLVIFTSDHGATFEGGNKGASDFHDSNHPFRGQKRTLWEGGIRVPGIVRMPGVVPAGRVSRAVVHNLDVLPSLLAAAGGSPNPAWRVDGRNLWDVWRGIAEEPSRTLFWEWRREGTTQLAAMNGRHKLVITGDNAPELFDVESDPAERRNVAASRRETARTLETELRAWIATERKTD